MIIVTTFFAKKICFLLASLTILVLLIACPKTYANNLTNVTIVLSDNFVSSEIMAARVLSEEVEKRTGLKWEIRNDLPVNGNVIVLSSNDTSNNDIKKEGYKLRVTEKSGNTQISISAIDGRGVLYGVGKLLRMFEWKKGEIISIPIKKAQAY